MIDGRRRELIIQLWFEPKLSGTKMATASTTFPSSLRRLFGHASPAESAKASNIKYHGHRCWGEQSCDIVGIVGQRLQG